MPRELNLTKYPLKSQTVREWHGLVFVVPAANGLDGAAFEPYAQDPGEFARLRLEEAKVVHTEVYQVAANWKTVWENFRECYHCSTNHPEFLQAYDLESLYDENGETGIVRLKDGMCSMSMDGRPVCHRPFGAFADVPTSEWTLHFAEANPAFSVSATPDYAVVISATPVSAEHTEYRADWLVHRDAVEGVDYVTEDVVTLWHQTNLQDIALCESAQRGMHSGAFEPGPLSPLREPFVAAFHHSYADWLREARAEAGSREVALDPAQ
jgi:Rieske 2Fe-2S family protein